MARALWQDSYAKYITHALKQHDYELFAERRDDGIIGVYRKGKRFVPVIETETESVYATVFSPHFIFALTHNWQSNGVPRRWGADIVVDRVRKHDLWANEDFFKKLEEQDEQMDASKKKDFLNQTEAWLSDSHSKFKKAFSDVRHANMDKSEKRRRVREKNKEIKNK